MFIDKGLLKIKAGDGGNGIVSFRRERYIDMGGPDGGDGGDGGDIVFIGSKNVNTLRKFRYSQLIKAPDGKNGGNQKKHGRGGEDLLVKVPVGTLVFKEDELLGDITESGQKIIIAAGGGGGFGNAHFKSSRRQAPQVAENGEPGDEFEARLELKLIADVGLIGLPNAGKSTFLSVVSNAKPEIADYPFTTLTPNLGVADIDSDSLLIADIPGLIEGASEGKGLGDEFLRHVERTSVLIHLIDAYSDDIAADYKVIREELKNYKIDLSSRRTIAVISKTDGLDDEIIQDQIKKIKKVMKKGDKLMTISSISHTGLEDLLRETSNAVKEIRQAEAEAQAAEDEEAGIEEGVPIYTLKSTFEDWTVTEEKDGTYTVIGEKIERFAKRTDYENDWGVYRLKDIMRKLGILRELGRKGAKADSVVYFGKRRIWKVTL